MKHLLIILSATLIIFGIINYLISCTYKEYPELQQERFQLKQIDILTRYGGNKASLIWEGNFHVLYWQTVNIEDTSYYRIGMYLNGLVRK